jgi:AcrR family transcriptional regulator
MIKRKEDRQVSDLMRKNPTQARAGKTVEILYEATAQILQEEGEQALNTNRIAARAGFSIGTLYQYFPSKEAIVLALIDRERNRVIAELQTMLKQAEQKQVDSRQLLRLFIQTLIRAFGTGTGHKMRRTLVKMAWRLDHTEPIVRALNQMASEIAQTLMAIKDPDLRPPTAAGMYVLSRAVMGAIRSASLEDTPLLGTQEFEDEVVVLAYGMLCKTSMSP